MTVSIPLTIDVYFLLVAWFQRFSSIDGHFFALLSGLALAYESLAAVGLRVELQNLILSA